MGFNIVLTGMVLSAIPVGEYDKRITILTRERGKITAFAKGARRSGNQLLAAANPFAFGQFEVYQGKSTYTAVRADIKNYFRELAEDFDMVCYGYYFLEMAEYYAQENADEVERLRLLYQTLRALESRKFSFALIRGIYEIDGSTLYAMQYIISTSVEKLYTFRLTPAVEAEFLNLLQSYRNHYVGHKFKSENFI